MKLFYFVLTTLFYYKKIEKDIKSINILVINIFSYGTF
jgi:hypothetical protein